MSKPAAASRHILRSALDDENIDYIMGDGYYAFINVSEAIGAGNYKDSEALGAYLAEDFGIAVVPGVYFSQAGANWVRFSYAQPPERTEKAVAQFFRGLKSLG